MQPQLSKKAGSLFTALVMVFAMPGAPSISARGGVPASTNFTLKVLATDLCYVNASAGGANTGASWVDAYTDLQSALGASPCTEVWVATGTYKPTSGTDRAISFMLLNGVALYGGFAGVETQRSQRDPAANLTTLSGDIGATGDATDNSYHVVSGGGTDGTAVLDGFTVTGGNANGYPSPANVGGGMYNVNSSPTLTNVIFSGNSALGNFGGGMYNANSSPTLTNVTFSYNSAYDHGGGMFNNRSSSPTLTNVTFSGNSASSGGGMYNTNSSNPTLTNVTFSGNTAPFGGGMYNGDNSSPTLTNVTFSGNSALSYDGGGMTNYNSSPTLTNVTFSGNSASSGGGMYNSGSSNPQIRDSIFWANSASWAGAEIYNSTSSLSLADSVVAGGCPYGATCANLLTTDPQLGPLANNGGFTQTMALGAGSSAIDTGNDATCASTDQRGVVRPQGMHCDIGAYEWMGHTISGHAGVARATLSYADGFPQTVSVDLNGDYTLGVTQGWSGTVTPSKLGWSFTPDHRDYANVLSDLTGQDYSATRYAYVVSGNVGLAGATLSYTDGTDKTVQSDGSGNYLFTVSYNWSGTVTPSKPGWLFAPDHKDYANVLSDQTGQDYTAAADGPCYVNASASGANNGNSWANAYTDLQSALGALPCAEVWVAAGTYKPTGSADRAISFTLKNDVALYGGFAGVETQRSQRDPAANATILSGDIGTTGYIYDNSYHVVSGGGTNGTAVLDGFKVTGGNANGSSPADSGGGMYNENSSPTLTNVAFSDNTASSGGGMWNHSSNPTLTNVTFSSNTADDQGAGGMNNEYSNPTLTNVIFSDNSGGGMINRSSSPTLTNVTFSGNSGTSAGGGMNNWLSSPVLRNVTFSGNGNSALSYGGGMYNGDNSSPTLTNVTFSGNSANMGGGMYNWSSSSPTLTNVTFSGNSAIVIGGGMYNYSSSPQIRDSILWGNSASVDGAEIYNQDSNSSPSLADSVVAGGCPLGATCANILTTDPLLGPLASNGGFTQTIALGAGSSAIDAGNDATCASTDQRGVARPQGAHCDMGAYEWVDYPYWIYLPLVIR